MRGKDFDDHPSAESQQRQPVCTLRARTYASTQPNLDFPNLHDIIIIVLINSLNE